MRDAGSEEPTDNGQLFSPRQMPLSMLSPAVARNRGILGHAVNILQSPGYAMKALADGINQMDHALGASLPENVGCLTKVHFRVNHPPSRPQVDDVGVKMHLLGSLKQLGCWEEQRAKTMKRCPDGWEIICYLGTGETFEYQYILKDYDGVPAWRSSAERQQTVDEIGGSNTLEIIDFITTGEEETGNLYNVAAKPLYSSHVRALPPTPRDAADEESKMPEVSLPEFPAGVDVGRDSSCALPRDSLLPPPTSQFTKTSSGEDGRESLSGFEDCRRPSVLPPSTPFEDCKQWLTGPSDSPSKNQPRYSESTQHATDVGAALSEVSAAGCKDDSVHEAQADHENEHEFRMQLSKQKAANEAKQQRLDLAAKQISSIVALVLQPEASFHAASCAATIAQPAIANEPEATDEDTQDMLTLAISNLRDVLERQRLEHAQATATLMREQEPQQQRADDSVHTTSIESERNAVQQQLNQLEGQLSELDNEYKEAMHAHELELAAKGQEIKTLENLLEEERQLGKMRSRRLRGGIRAVQGQLSGVRSGFDDLKAEVARMTSEVMPELAGMATTLTTSIVTVAQRVQADLDETNSKFQGETRERKRLHNLVQELKGNIRVFARIRPISQGEKEAGKKSVTLCATENDVSLGLGGGKMSSFTFDKVFGQESTQQEVFEETGPLVVSVLDGYNVCIFAYGQTGSGKTHTMEGCEAMRGVNYRSLELLFALAQERRRVAKYEFKVSLLEIYNEQIKDLIELHDEKGELKKLDVKNDPNGGTYVGGCSSTAELQTTPVSSMQDVLDTMALGMRNRSTSSTQMNSQSSRSHCILSVYVTCTDLLKGGTTYGKMHLVDLAGSERLSRTGAEGSRLTEAKNINKSLSALGNCISSLVAKAKYTPFRESKLTHFLQDSLGGDAKMLMFVCASPCDADAQESKCSLEFATRVGTVELGSAKRRGDGGAGAVVKELQAQLKSSQEAASKTAGDHAQLEEELARARQDAASKSHEATCLLQALKQKEHELSLKVQEGQQHIATIHHLQQQGRQVNPLPQTLPPALAGRQEDQARSKRQSSPPPDLGGAQSDVHKAPLLTRRASVTPREGCADDQMSASVSTKIAAEAAAVVAGMVNEAAADPLCAYLHPPAAAEISFSEVEEKENSDRNTELGSCTPSLGSIGTEAGEADPGCDDRSTQVQARAETLEERLEKFRQKKEEAKKRNMAVCAADVAKPMTPSKRELGGGGTGLRKAPDLVNPCSDGKTSRLSIRPQSAMARAPTAIPKASALSGGPARPKSALAKGSAIPGASTEKVASRLRRGEGKSDHRAPRSTAASSGWR